MTDNSSSNETNFGFKKVNFAEKRNLVNEVFSNVAANYDLMNDVMSLGVHRFWKDQFCHQIPDLTGSILDVAGGTGDIALRLLKKAGKKNKKPFITICDINYDMLKFGRDKAIDNGVISGINYICADAEKLPFQDNSFDYYTIAFGIRNVAKIDIALKEAYRVLKPLGKFLCLEFSSVEYQWLKPLYNFYSFKVIPKIGNIIAKNEEAYQYLTESIANFPNQEEFTRQIKQAGFNKVSYQNLSCGIAAIHSGYKL